MSEIVDTAGLRELTRPDPKELRREMLRTIRATMRKIDASDDEFDDALDALVELAKEKD